MLFACGGFQIAQSCMDKYPIFMKTQFFLAGIATLIPQLSFGSFVLTEVGNGTATLTGATSQVNATVTFSGMTVDRGAAGFGDNTTTVEGAYYTYSFTAPSVDNGAGDSNFDVQNTMGSNTGNQLWSGWGDDLNGPWQEGPTTSTWARGNRRQHLYSGANGNSTFVSSPPASDASVPVSGLSLPEFGDLLKVSVYLNAVDNTILSVYENLTKSESFEYLTTDANLPGGNLTFNTLYLRSDTGLSSMDYTYGTLVVPEPSTALLGMLGGLALLRRRKY